MTKAQWQRERLKALAAEREAELRLLAESRATADSRYVQDVVAWMWGRVLERKLKLMHEVRGAARRRLFTLSDLYA